MDALTLRIVSAEGTVRFEEHAAEELTIPWRGYYLPGDRIEVDCACVDERGDAELLICLDDCCAPSIVLARGGRLSWPIPFAERRSYGIPGVCMADRRWGYVRLLDPRERGAWRNVALNAFDYQGNECMYPRALTNVPAGNPEFFARNAIDGIFESSHHGNWPYGSWGMSGRDDARLKVEFGRPVIADELRVYLRADFPHDTWWERGLLTLSDGTEHELVFEKTGARQTFDLGGCCIEWLRLSNLQLTDDGNPSRFAALTQLMVMGCVA